MEDVHVRADLWLPVEDGDVVWAVREYMAHNDITTAFVVVDDNKPSE